jgi:hypothetical protein
MSAARRSIWYKAGVGPMTRTLIASGFALVWLNSLGWAQQSQAAQQQSPEALAAINAAIKHCVDVVHKMKPNEIYGQSYKHFDAYYNTATGMVENNAFLNVDQAALYEFRKCMAQEGYPLGGKSQ